MAPPRPQLSPSQKELVEQHLGFAKAQALDIAGGLPPHVDRDELIQIAQSALLEVATEFDAARCILFSTFAYRRVRGAVYDALRKSKWTTPRLRRHALRHQAAEDILAQSDGQPPATAEAAASRADEMIEAVASVFVLSQVLDDSAVEGVDDDRPDAKVEREEMTALVQEALATLDETDRKTLGFIYADGLTVTEIAQRYKVNKSTVSRAHTAALEKLRKYLLPKLDRRAPTTRR